MRTVEEKLAFKKKLEERTSDFAVTAFKCIDALPIAVSSKVISFQLGKSVSSIGANYREANRAESMDDFIHKIGITLKECSESLYWLDLIRRLYPKEIRFTDLALECEELLKIFQSIRRSIHDKLKGE